MFIFYHSLQKESNKSYYKGILFESLLSKYLHSTGFDIELRKKDNSLEYDLSGTNRSTKQQIIGEAKALEASVSGEAISSFVGKLLPKGLVDKKVFGLFLSTSPLTADAEDYFKEVESMGIKAWTGRNLFNEIERNLKLPTFTLLSEKLIALGYHPLIEYLLNTDSDIFKILITRSDKSGSPSHFAIFQTNSQMLQDKVFIEQLQNSIQELKALVPIYDTKYNESKSQRVIPLGLSVGSSWIDYRSPAGPKFFIGRKDFIQRVFTHISSNKTPSVIQIKSRSGVGKSSALAFLHNNLIKENVVTELHDARDIKSTLDILTIVQRFTGSKTIPVDFREAESYLTEMFHNTNISKAIFIVDQFESTFSNPDVYNSYEYLATLFRKFHPKLYIILARKNDQLTTYDDSKISLDRLNSFSQNYELQDLSKEEAIDLLEKINSAGTKTVSKEVLAYALEFAQGFPWLIKRTMAHIINLLTSNDKQTNLVEAGLKLDDLFEEELEALDEIEKEYLTKIASRLPSDFNQLQKHFDEDPLLPQILDKLTRSHLLRLSGATYDTYNDVFKEYLVYHKLPEFHQPLIYRMHPGTVLNSFHHVVNLKKFSTDKLEQTLNLSTGSAFNLIKEWRNLNLIRSDAGDWLIPQSILDIYGHGRLGDHIRRQLIDNKTVSKLRNEIAQGKKITQDALPDFLSEQFPFVDASKKTWATYANQLKTWLIIVKLIEIDDKDIFTIPNEDRIKIMDDLGNLINTKAFTRRSSTNFFIPSAPYKQVKRVLESCINSNSLPSTKKAKVFSDLRNGGWLIDNELTITSIEEFKEQGKFLLTSEIYVPFWDAVKKNKPLEPSFFQIMGKESYATSTVQWRIKTILSWGKGLELIPNKRFSPTS